jgi:predicted MFS family arabinose efflux permease
MMILAIILALLTFTHLVQAWHIIVLAFFLGCANAFDAPARQAFVTDLVDRQDLTNAIALNSTMFNAGTVLGPALAGLTYAAFGPQWCFTINAISFLAVIVALLRMNIPAVDRIPRNVSVLVDAREGLSYVLGHPIIRVIVLNMGVVSLFGLGFITLMPAWAVDVLGGNATTNGFLLSARGLGALAGALMIASFGQFHAKGRLLSIGSFVLPLSIIVLSTVRQLPITLLVLFAIGWGFMVMANMSNSLIQIHVDDALRGRVMGVYTLIFFGLMPLGSLFNGTIAAKVGPPMTVQINALIMLAFSTLLFLRAPGVRRLE